MKIHRAFTFAFSLEFSLLIFVLAEKTRRQGKKSSIIVQPFALKRDCFLKS